MRSLEPAQKNTGFVQVNTPLDDTKVASIQTSAIVCALRSIDERQLRENFLARKLSRESHLLADFLRELNHLLGRAEELICP